MIFMHKDLKEKGFSSYQIKKLVNDGKLYMVKDIYSTTKEINYLEYIAVKHPNAVLNLYTACYCYGLLKKNYKPYIIATKQKDRKIIDENIKQTFMTDELYEIGISNIKFQNAHLKVYDLERLLIEVIRNKVYLEYDIYQEIIRNYRRIIKLLNKKKLAAYLPYFKDKRIIERIEREIYN